MTITILLTMAFYKRYAEPLRELGYVWFYDAYHTGLITKIEMNMNIFILGTAIPDEAQMKLIIEDRFGILRSRT